MTIENHIPDKEELKELYIRIWGSRKKSGMSHTASDWNKRAVGWERELQEDENRKRRSERRVAETVKYLRSKGLLRENDEVIDIGCGPGRFVTEFARYAGHATGTDISENMCRFGLEYAHSQEIYNVDFVPCDFKEADIKAMGWEKKFDLVFSSITPAMSTYDSFRKSEQMSRAYCFQSNFVKQSDPVGEKILREVFGEQEILPERGMNGLMALFNILCLEGCHPEVTFFKESDEDIVRADEEFVHHLLKFTSVKEVSEDIRQKLVRTAEKYADAEGNIRRPVEIIYSWILWDVRERN